MTLIERSQPINPAIPLTAAVSVDGTDAVVTLSGEADVLTLPVVVDVLARVIADHDRRVIVDLARTEFIDSGTVRALVRASRYLDDHDRTLKVRSPSRLAVRILEVFGVTHLIELEQSSVA